ncbi:MAG TPA: flagellin [Caulobacteraceae bacterium]|jgi:flagellar hook-associated protein 3 FlgL|nr:flagellin [Caulobacteraceae bacterium]
MNITSTSDSWNSALLNLLNAEKTQTTAQNQVSTGKVGDDLQSYGQGAETLTAMQGAQARLNGFIQSGQLVSSRLSVQDTAFTQISTAGTSARQAITNALASGTSTGLMQSIGEYYQQAVDGLNTESNGVYIFGGGRADLPPVSSTTLTALNTTGVAASFQNGPLKTTSQIDNTTTVQTGFLASDVGTDLLGAFQQIETLDQGPNGPLSGQLTQAQITALQGVLSSFDGANTEVTNYQAENGALQQNVTNHITAQKAQSDSLTSLIGNQTNVDMATALTKLTQAQQSVQASAQVLASLQNDSLMNILSATA